MGIITQTYELFQGVARLSNFYLCAFNILPDRFSYILYVQPQKLLLNPHYVNNALELLEFGVASKYSSLEFQMQ